MSTLIFLGILFTFRSDAQTVASWNFNNTLAGTAGSNASVTNAILGSSIGSGAYNGGTVYFGEDGWPSGGLDPNAYIEFSVSPSAMHSLTIGSMQLSIRRSTTGTGSGPRNWALRSSQDGYAADISNGTLSTSISVIPVTFNASFANLPGTVTFRLYGYNAIVTSGGLNRFVFDNFSISGSSGVLPVVFDSFDVFAESGTTGLSWHISGGENIVSMIIERSSDGKTFEEAGQIPVHGINSGGRYVYTDHLNNPSGNYYYRIKLVNADNKISYSPVRNVSFGINDTFKVQAINTGIAQDIRFRITSAREGLSEFDLYDMNGTKLAAKQINLSAGSQCLVMEHGYIRPGIYLLTASQENRRQVIKIAIQ